MWNKKRVLLAEQETPSAEAGSYWQALRLAMVFAAIKLILHTAANLYTPHLGYGMLHDELYYVVCGRHLAWGYVDHGPMVAVQARIAESLFGLWLPGLRIFSASAGAVPVGLTGLLAWSLGGRRAAQIVAMMAVLMAPQYLALDGILSMNSFESMFWMGCVLIVILMLRKRRAHLWLVFGVLAGLGFLNKPSIALFLVALCAGLMVTPQQRTISSPWVLAAFLEIVLLALPFLHWQSQHGFAMVQFLAVGAKNRMDLVAIAAFCFLGFARIFVQPVSHSWMAIVPASTPVIDHFGSERSPMRKSPYLIDRHPLVDSHGFSCTPAPWGGITAVNLNTLKEVWEKPLGTMIPGQQTGIRNFGGPIVTASGLVITAGAEDSALRIFDSATGEELQTVALPVPAVATPMTYTIAGRQYIVVAAGGHGDKTVPLGDALIAFAVN